MENIPAFSVIEAALLDGCKLRACRSGGGLRVLSLTKKNRSCAYGEAPHIDVAFQHCAEDYEAGGRPYSEVYGGKYDHYITGSSSSNSELDACLLEGKTFEAWVEDGMFVLQLSGIEFTEWPENALERIRQEGLFLWTTPRGVVFRILPVKFANGEIGTTMRQISKPEGMAVDRVHLWPATRTGKANTIAEAIAAALKAPSVEVFDEEDQ